MKQLQLYVLSANPDLKKASEQELSRVLERLSVAAMKHFKRLEKITAVNAEERVKFNLELKRVEGIILSIIHGMDFVATMMEGVMKLQERVERTEESLRVSEQRAAAAAGLKTSKKRRL